MQEKAGVFSEVFIMTVYRGTKAGGKDRIHCVHNY